VVKLADRNDVRKEAEKKVKYKSLCIEIQRMSDPKCKIMPVTIGATGIATKVLGKNVEATPGIHSADSIQTAAALGTLHIIWKVLQSGIEARAVGIAIGSRGEVSGRKHL